MDIQKCEPPYVEQIKIQLQGIFFYSKINEEIIVFLG